MPAKIDYDAVLNAWSSGKTASEIMEMVKAEGVDQIYKIVERGRYRKDPRAARRVAVNKYAHLSAEIVMMTFANNPGISSRGVARVLACSVDYVARVVAAERDRVEAARATSSAVAVATFCPHIVKRNGVSLPRLACIDGPAP